MTFQTPVPSDVDADSFLDLAVDCREVAAVLAAMPVRVLNLTAATVPRVVRLPMSRLPMSRVPLARLPLSFGVMPADITDDLLVGTVSGLDDY